MEHGEHTTHTTHERHAGHDIGILWRKFRVVLVLTIPVVIYSTGIQRLLHFTPPAFPGSAYVPPVLSTIIFFYGGLFFLRGAITEIQARALGMMTLIALAITVAYVYSVAVTFGLRGEPLYWELSTLVTVMLFGHWMEMRAIGAARGALRELARWMPDEAERITGGQMEVIPVSELRKGDLVLIRPGAKVPADGEVVEGESDVNEAMITGESMPVPKSPGSEVIGGTVNGDGSLRVRVTKVGEETALAGIMKLVEQAQASRSMAQNLADRAAYWLTIIALSVAAITFIAWEFFSGRPGAFALERTVTVMVIACPHALGLAIPLVVAISTTLAARNGLLVRDRLALELARNLDVVVFDKTGTLTKGEQGVVGVYTVGDMDENRALALAASVEKDSEHIIARAIVRAAEDRHLELPQVEGFRALPGRGVEARIDGRTIMVGGPGMLSSKEDTREGEAPSEPDASVAPLGSAAEASGSDEASPSRPALFGSIEEARQAGQTVVYLVDEDHVKAAFALADVIRPESREAVQGLREEGIGVAMMTGDSEDVARWVAGELGIDEYYAGVLPEDKAKKVEELRRQGKRVAMVGDGVNDAPALVAADVGIAIGAGTDVAVEAGGIVLVRNDPRDVVRIVRLSKSSYRKMVQNLLWATGYNVVAIPLAAGVLAGYGIILPPAVGALFMSVSTVIVAANAQLLRRINL